MSNIEFIGIIIVILIALIWIYVETT